MWSGAVLVPALVSLVGARHLFFGETWSGKSTLINVECGASERVADHGAGQIGSTTKQVKGVPCRDTEAVDTIGSFDYDENETMRIGTAEILATLLENAANFGLSSVLFVWPSLRRTGNAELEGVFKSLRRLLPEVPMAIVENQFPGYASHVPRRYSDMFGLPLLAASDQDTTALRSWMAKHTKVVRVSLPEGWRDWLKKFDLDELRRELLSASLMACSTVKQQLDAITAKLHATREPDLRCECGTCDGCKTDCRRSEGYCCGRILGVCSKRCKKEWVDMKCQEQVKDCVTTCQRQISECRQECIQAHQRLVDSTREQLGDLTAAFQNISVSNQDLLQTCDRFRIVDAAPKSEL